MTQLELVVCKVPMRGTQLYEILMCLQHGEKLTVAKALSELGVYALSQRIGELKKLYNWPIKSEMIKVGAKTYVAEYSL